MPLSSTSGNSFALLLLEGGLTAISIAAAFAWPSIGNSAFACIERVFGSLARKKALAVATVGFATLFLRLAILPLFPVPLPFNPNDFSNLLAADTFAHGRLANPTPAMWTHFEAIQVDMKPTYMSMYFPGEGLALAAGKVFLGNPWYGNLISSAFMCAALCWMLQAWLPPGWALLGGLLAMLRLGLFSYWINSYTGAGLIAALGGALVLGSLPRLMKTTRFRNGLLMAVGIVLLVLSRPYEGLLLCLPVAVVLFRWAFWGKNRPTPGVLFRRAVAPLLLLVAAGAWMGYYDYRAFGSPATLPYTINRATYAMAPYYIWQSPRPEPQYRHEMMRRFYYGAELLPYLKLNSWSHYVPTTLTKAWAAVLFFAGLALLPPLIMLRRVLLDRRIRFLVICVLILMAGNLIMSFMIAHYLAPFTAAFYAIGLQAARHLRAWTPEGRAVGAALVRLAITTCFLVACVRLLSAPLGFHVPEWSAGLWEGTWVGPDHYGIERARVQAQLARLPGGQLAIVRYSANHDAADMWVYNEAGIDAAKVVWAWDMDSANNRELIQYYKDRQVWLVQPDKLPVTPIPYPGPEQPNAATR